MKRLGRWLLARWTSLRRGGDDDPRHDLGRRGEDLATAHLANANLRCIDRNVRIKGGEIDLICESADGTIVFVEVKTRTGDVYRGELAINRDKRRRLLRLAQLIARKRGWLDRRLRIDVVVIVWPRAGEPIIRHHPNAVTLDG